MVSLDSEFLESAMAVFLTSSPLDISRPIPPSSLESSERTQVNYLLGHLSPERVLSVWCGS